MTLRIAGHPVHPMLVHFPICSWTVAAAAEIAGWITHGEVWWQIGFAAQGLGVITATLAMVAGVADYAGLARGHPAQGTANMHMLAMGLAWLMFVTSLALRGMPTGVAPPVWASMATACGFGALAIGGWLGGRLVYGFGVGVRRRALDAGQ